MGSYLSATTSLFNSLVLIVPVFVLYQAGVIYQLWIEPGGAYSINGADYLTRYVVWICRGSVFAYIGFVAIASVGIGWLLRYLGQRDGLDVRMYPPMLAESVVYALIFASTIHLMQSAPQILTPGRLSLAGPTSTWEVLFQSFGAGFNEEIIFRLGLLGGIVLIGRWTPLPSVLVLSIAFIASSLAFSAFHYLGPYRDALLFDSFMYRFLAGILLGTIFWWRGLAVAVYTHAIYDIYFFFVVGT